MSTGLMLAGGGMNPLEHVVGHTLFTVSLGGYELAVSNQMLMVLVAAVLMVVVFVGLSRRASLLPRGLGNLVETICVFLREEVARPALGDRTDTFVSYLWTTFFFVLFCNLLGLVPTSAVLELASGGRWRHMGGAATANIWVTGALAVCSFLMIHVAGIRQQGLGQYVKHFIPPVPWPLIPLMYVLEIIGALVKPFALAIRLFANMIAGHAVLGAFLGLILMFHNWAVAGATVAAATALSILELFVAFLQAYIFTYLTAMFIGAAVRTEH